MKKLLLVGILLGSLTIAEGQKQRKIPEQTFPNLINLEEGKSRADAQLLFKHYFNVTTDDEMRLSGTESDDLGFTHEKFQQYYKGIKVEGATYTIHSKGGQVKTMSGNFRGITHLEVTPVITKTVALNLAFKKINAKVYAWEDVVKSGYPDYKKPVAELVIFADPGLRQETALAYKFDIYAIEPLYRAWVFVDARTGKVIAEYSRIYEANVKASAKTRYNGTRAITADHTGSNNRLRQTTSDGGVETYSLNNGTDLSAATDITNLNTTFTSDPTANQAHWAAERGYYYYLTQHNRSSYDNAGAVIKSYVHYSTGFGNAYWIGSAILFLDGNETSHGPMVSVDVCGHELTHGITQTSADLVYQGESGALNESFSDIFGEAIENYSTGRNDWLIGKDIGIGRNGAFRSLSNPNQYGHPDTYGGTYWRNPICIPDGTNDGCGVHSNSGVQNKWFYIISKGESGTNDLGDSYSVTGLGLTKAAKIAYRNLTVYLSPGSNYANARSGAIQAAIDLYGAGSPEEIATTNAWFAVGVGNAYCNGCTNNYCLSYGANSSFESIKTVTIGSFTNNSGSAGYTDFTSETINLSAGSSNNINLIPGFSSMTRNESWKVWIDFNTDGDFTDAGEEVFSEGPGITTSVSGTIAIPASATGTTRMRITMKYNEAPASPCENFSYGEVEDYTVLFSNSVSDKQPPSAPILSLTGATNTTFSLSWTASTDNAGVAGYNVYVDNTFTKTTTALTYTVTGLKAATSYLLRVKAKDAAGNGTSSHTITGTTETGPDTQPPTEPTLSSTGATSTTIGLTWTPSTDDEGVAGYDVYVDDALVNTTTATSYMVTGLKAATSYILQVKAKDAAGNVANSNTITVTTQSSDAPVTILAHYFETGWDGWTEGGNNCGRYRGSRSYEGDYSIYLSNNSGTASAMTSSAYNVTAYNQLVIDFYFYSYNMEPGEDFFVRYFDGVNWTTVATFVSESSYSGDGFYHAIVPVNNVIFSTEAKFRFQCDASSDSDLIYIDQVKVTGRNGTSMGFVQNNNTPTCIQLSAPGGFISKPLTNNSLDLYPNPATSTVIIQTSGAIKAVKFYSANGAMIRRYGPVKSGEKLDISTLASGLYILAFETEDGIIRRKLVKQ